MTRQDAVLTWIARSASAERGAGSARVDARAVVAAAARVMAESALTAEEERAVREASDPVEHLLALRVARALAAAREAAHGGSGGRAPAVVLARDAEGATATVAETLARRDGGTVVVLARTEALETLRRDAGTLRELAPTLAFPGAEEDGDGDLPPTVVLPVGEDLLAEVRRAVRELGLDDTGPTDPLVGRVFANKYELERCIGRGGFGSVYVAKDLLLENRIAIKVLTPRTAVTEEQKRDFRLQLEEFKQEARRVVRLEHDNIVNWKVFDQTEDGTYYFAMELLEGEELEDLLKREGRLSPERVGTILLQVLAALRFAHHLSPTESILHLDLKPKNVFHLAKRGPDGSDRVKVIDFGIGQYVGGDGGDRAAPGPVRERGEGEGEDGTLATAAWQPGGTLRSVIHRSTACTPEYASPEQCAHMLSDDELERMGLRRRRLDGRSDLYSLGVMGFQLLTGKLPFERPRDRRDFLRLHIREAPLAVRSLGVKVPRKLARFVDRCLAKAPDDRFADSNEAYEVLERAVRPVRWALLATAGAAVAAAGAVAAWALTRPAFGVFAAPQELADGLWTCPDCPPVVVDGGGLPSDLVGAAARLVGNANRADETALAWSVEWRGSDLVLAPPPGAADLDATAFLELRPAGGAPAYSSGAFALRCLPAEPAAVAALDVPGRGVRAVDPERQRLRVEVDGPARDLRSVVVRGPFAGERRPTPVESGDPQRAAFALDLSDLGLEEGEAELTAVAVDRAGRETQLAETLPFAAEPLRFTAEPRLAGAALSGGRYLVSATGAPVLELALNRRADLSWKVRDSGGAVLKSGIRSAHAGEPIELDLSAPDDYSGWIEVSADEEAYVLHAAASRGRASSARIEFEYSSKVPELAAVLLGEEGELRLAPGTPLFTARPALRLRAVRLNQIPVHVEVVVDGRTADVRALHDPVERSFEAALELGGEGAHALELRARRSVDGQPQGEPVVLGPFAVVLDPTPPALRVVGPADFVASELEWSPPDVRVEVTDGDRTGTELATPVTLTWVAKLGEVTIASGGPIEGLPGELVPLPLAELPALARSAQRRTLDGVWSVEVEGRDAAGNSPERVTFQWTVACEGPSIEPPRKPVPVLEWVSSSSSGRQEWEVEVRVTDPNHVRFVRCVVRDVTAELEPFDVPLEDIGDSVWSGAVVFPAAWSGREVELCIDAVDKLGRSSATARHLRVLGEIRERYPERVALALAGRPDVELEPMCFVQGNRSASYSFRGRGDTTEERDFRRAFGGAYVYNAKELTKSWALSVEREELRDFYLDQREVSARQYLGFLESDGGWDDARWWEGLGTPPAGRRAALLARMAELARDDLPATDVTWEEATAYARFAGKELMTFLQWEWAVRGPEYRPYSAYAGEVGVADAAHVNYWTPAKESAGPWPGSRGGDATPDTGVRDLCSNVSEWTRTPLYFRHAHEAPLEEDPARHAARHRASFVDPGPEWIDCPQYWVAGASYDDPCFDFSFANVLDRERSSPRIGFRCALPAAAVKEALLPTAGGVLRAREVPR